jgi:hypothetical protein
MPPSGDLLNKGFIVNPGVNPEVNQGTDRGSRNGGRTFIVTGLLRSGTSLVASILQQAGIFIGSEINDIVFEDEAIARILISGDTAALHRIIGERNANYRTWGFKLPVLCRYLEPAQLALFDDPHLVVTFRDPVSMSVRTSLSEYQRPMDALREAMDDLNALMAFIASVRCPSLLLSYEKALMMPHDFVDAVMRFCGLPENAALRERLVAVIEPNRASYVAGARRRYEGVIEGVLDGRLYGWCRLTHSTDPVAIEVLVDDASVVTLAADVFRQDLLDAGVGQGSHGFFIPLEVLHAAPDGVIRIRVADHGIELHNSGKRLRELASMP